MFVDEITELIENVYLIPHKKIDDLAKIGERAKLYKRINDDYIPDDFCHEMSLVFDTDDGVVIFNSCSHSGIVNIIEEVKDYFGNNKKILAFIGGLHMKGKSGDKEICTFTRKEIEIMIQYLNRNSLSKLYTGHCTGIVGYEMLKEYLGDKIEYINTGKEIVL